MAATELVCSVLGPDRRLAIRAAEGLRRFTLTLPDDAAQAGDVLLGRAGKRAPDMDAVFVDIGEARDGLLMARDAPVRLNEGDAVVVEVIRSATEGKGAKLRGCPSADGVRPADLRPPAVLARADPLFEAIEGAMQQGPCRLTADDPAVLAEVARRFGEAVTVEPLYRGTKPLFAAIGVDEEIEQALAPEVELPHGGRLRIAETPAAVTIDIDSAGRADLRHGSSPRAINEAAMAAIGREIERRELAGLIVIDWLPMSRGADRAAVRGVLETALAAGDRTWQLREAGRDGPLLLTRERRGPSLRERLMAACPLCAGGRVRAPDVVAGDALRQLIASSRATPASRAQLLVPAAVAQSLAGRMAPVTRAAEALLGERVVWSVRQDLPPDRFEIAPRERG